jgi:hypothetical protein
MQNLFVLKVTRKRPLWQQLFICVSPTPLLGLCLGVVKNFWRFCSESGHIGYRVQMLQYCIWSQLNPAPSLPPQTRHRYSVYIKYCFIHSNKIISGYSYTKIMGNYTIHFVKPYFPNRYPDKA